nr:hypothetical protein [Paraburkholderia sp. BL8N3]
MDFIASPIDFCLMLCVSMIASGVPAEHHPAIVNPAAHDPRVHGPGAGA